MNWRPCKCPDRWYYRIERAWWVRLLSRNRRLYKCVACGQTFLLQPRDVPQSSRLLTQPPAPPGEFTDRV
jgi:hypothetical protein